MSLEDHEENEKYVCLNCIPDKGLRERLRDTALSVICNYCSKSDFGVSTEELAECIREPLTFALRFGGHAGIEGEWIEEGDSLNNVLAWEFEFEGDLADDVAKILIDNDPAWPPDGEEPFFREDEQYVRDDRFDTQKYLWVWRRFEDTLKHQSRFFNDFCREDLERILGAPGSAQANELPIRIADETTKNLQFFRSRLADSESMAREICEAPESQLGACPPKFAKDGRMNGRGISVFYGALSQDVAVSEIRPSVGSLVVVGEFRPARQLRLLDLPALQTVKFSIPDSIFAEGYLELQSRQHFLRGFHSLIVKPIQPHHEALEYIPTQAVAEYIANVLNFDGIIYDSVQVGSRTAPPGTSSQNVAIFRSRVTRVFRSNPLKFEPDSLRVVRVRGVTYTSEDSTDIIRPFPF